MSPMPDLAEYGKRAFDGELVIHATTDYDVEIQEKHDHYTQRNICAHLHCNRIVHDDAVFCKEHATTAELRAALAKCAQRAHDQVLWFMALIELGEDALCEVVITAKGDGFHVPEGLKNRSNIRRALRARKKRLAGK